MVMDLEGDPTKHAANPTMSWQMAIVGQQLPPGTATPDGEKLEVITSKRTMTPCKTEKPHEYARFNADARLLAARGYTIYCWGSDVVRFCNLNHIPVVDALPLVSAAFPRARPKCNSSLKMATLIALYQNPQTKYLHDAVQDSRDTRLVLQAMCRAAASSSAPAHLRA